MPKKASGDPFRANEAGKRFERLVLSREVPIADIPLTKLTRAHVRVWRAYVEQLTALVSRSKSNPKQTRSRSTATVNRDMVDLRAALNLALENGHVLSDSHEASCPARRSSRSPMAAPGIPNHHYGDRPR